MIAYELVQQQAQRPELWCITQRIAEDILQRALRDLHAAVEQEERQRLPITTEDYGPTRNDKMRAALEANGINFTVLSTDQESQK